MMYSYLMLQQKKTDTDVAEVEKVEDEIMELPATTCSCFQTLCDIMRSHQS
jgi:hypothetical protein